MVRCSRVMVTSADHGDGKTTVAANLGRALQQAGHTGAPGRRGCAPTDAAHSVRRRRMRSDSPTCSADVASTGYTSTTRLHPGLTLTLGKTADGARSSVDQDSARTATRGSRQAVYATQRAGAVCGSAAPCVRLHSRRHPAYAALRRRPGASAGGRRARGRHAASPRATSQPSQHARHARADQGQIRATFIVGIHIRRDRRRRLTPREAPQSQGSFGQRGGWWQSPAYCTPRRTSSRLPSTGLRGR